jgi:flagellar hook-length control protein FliK
MQEFAATQTSIAANKLPYEDAKLSLPALGNISNSSFDHNAQNEITQKSAFEEALARHEQLSQATAKNAVSGQKLSGDNITDDFDWVAYVNQVKDLSEPSEVVLIDQYLKDKSSTHAIFEQTMAALNSDGEVLVNIKPVDVNMVDTGYDTEFLKINIAEEEIATSINVAAGNSEEPLGLNIEAMTGLDNAIAKLLNQPVSKEDRDASINAELETNDIAEDADLLNNFLQTETLETSAEQKLLMSSENDIEKLGVVIKSDVWLAQAKSLIDEVTLTKNDKVVKIAKSNLAALKNDDNLIQKSPQAAEGKQAVLAEVEMEAVNATLSQTVKPLIEKTDKATESPSFRPVDKASIKKEAQLLAKLSPEAQSSALDNIALRLKSLISELKTEGKSTEFIAALQSGIKEMKEQLKQGRELGTDLKRLVTDALTAVDINVTGKTEAAIGNQLNEVSNILAAAASLNQTNQQQNYLNTGLNEVQGIREVAQQQIESTRLVQQTAVYDKGVSIFKPEGQQQLTEKVRWMVNSRNISAEIRLDPPDLGGMNIKVNLSGDSASVSFVVQSQHARDALDQAAPRLREMLEEHGIELGQSSVQQESAGDGGQAEQGSLANNSNDSGNLAQQSHDGIQDSNEDGLLGHNGVIEQGISGGRIGGIDYYA